jgi:hypothetical protein
LGQLSSFFCAHAHATARGAGLSLKRAALYWPRRNTSGGMAEWLKAHAWKACIRETVSWVRIPLPPPRTKSLIYLTFLSLRGYELLRTFRGFAARAPTPLFAQRRIFRRSRAFAGARLSCAFVWYGSLLQSQYFSDERTEHANQRSSRSPGIANPSGPEDGLFGAYDFGGSGRVGASATS